jgi:hypothetical protein
LSVVLACLMAAPADAEDLATNMALAGQPADQALTPQFGKPLCVSHDASAGTASYYFQSGHGAIMTVVVNELHWALDSSHVIAVTVTTNPLLLNGCAGPTQASMHNDTFQLAASAGHLQLGDSLDHTTRILGKPETTSGQDGLIGLEYSWDRDLYHKDLWTLSFRDGRLVEWTIRTAPVFYEVGG